MEWLQLENGVKIPQVGLGVWQSGPNTEKAVCWALEAGYRHIDTAAIYGNEEAVGRGMRDSGIPRGDIFLTTKLWTEDVRRGRTREALMESLRKLGTDYVDLYLIHWPAEGYEKAWQDMAELYHEGWCRAIGVSNFEEDHLASLEGAADIKPQVDQFESHPSFQNNALLSECRDERIIAEAYSPLGRGSDLENNAVVQKIAKKYDRTPAQVILRWHIQRGVVVIPKSVHKERIEENLDIFDFKLRKRDMDALNAMKQGKRLGSDPHHFAF